MPQKPALSSEQIADFQLDGVLRLAGLVQPEATRLARQPLHRRLAELGLWEEGARQAQRSRPRWPAIGVKPARDIGHRRPEVAALFEAPAVAAVVAAILHDRPVDRTIWRRPQVLVSLPNAGPWVSPEGWHVDIPRLSGDESPGVQLFVMIDSVAARGGGTFAVAGSHRLFNDRGVLRTKDVGRLTRAEPFFRALRGGFEGQDLPGGFVGDVPVQVVELTGEPGDAWLIDLRVLHTASPNAAERPRMMATQRYVCTDVMPAIAAAFGWVSDDKPSLDISRVGANLAG